MTFVRRRLLTVPLLVFALSAPGTASVHGAASEPPPTVPYGNRTDTFRRLLFELQFQPLPGFTELHDNPSESLLILLGDPGCLSKVYFPDGLRDFVAQGGAVLIATDKETGGRAGEMLSELAGVTVTGETLIDWRDNLNTNSPLPLYGNSKHCPFIEPLEGSKVPGVVAAFIGAAGRPDLFRIQHSGQPSLRVATNAPSRLKVRGLGMPFGIHRLAQLSSNCREEFPHRGRRFQVGEDGKLALSDKAEPSLFAVGGTVGKGRVLVMADHSIFINRMILPRDNDNLEFAINCLHWLRGGVASPTEALTVLRSQAEGGIEVSGLIGQRNKVLFWEDRRVHRSFEVPLRKVSLPIPPVIPPEPVIVAAFDQTIANLEASDAFNTALLQHIDDLPGKWPGVIRNTVYLLTLATALFLAYRFLWRSRHRPELATPSLAEALRKHEPRASLLDQRRRALLRSGNVWEMGHRLARECFESAGVAMAGASQPRVRVMQGSGWRRRHVRCRVIRLWRLARGEATSPISPIALQRLQRELEQLKTALADGTITLS